MHGDVLEEVKVGLESVAVLLHGFVVAEVVDFEELGGGGMGLIGFLFCFFLGGGSDDLL